MATFEQIVALVGHLAWPLAAIVVAFKFAPTIRELAGRASKLKVAGAEIELSDRLREVREIAAEEGVTLLVPSQGILRERRAPSPTVPPDSPAPAALSRIEAARGLADEAGVTRWVWAGGRGDPKALDATADPGLYLAEIWADLEKQVRDTARARAGAEPMGYPAARRLLIEAGVLDDALTRLLDALHATRNAAAPAAGLNLTRAEAAEWGGVALTLSQRIDQRARMKGRLAGPPPAG